LEWPVWGADLVVGVWALCYLGWDDVNLLLSRLSCSLKPGGRVILNEPILKDGAVEEEKW